MATRQSYSTIACASPGDASRLAVLLSTAAQWAGQVPPDLVETSGSEVELTWYSTPAVQAASVSAAVSSAKGSAVNIGFVALTHTTTGSGGKTTQLARQ